MGELHVNMHTTLDGVIQANGGATEADRGFEYAGWQWPYWDDESSAQVDADVEASDALLLGRTTYDIFRQYGPGQQSTIGRVFDRVPKYVASRGTPELSWETSVQVTDVAAQVPEMLEQHEQIQTWGSGQLLQELLAEGLVDQLNLWVCPIVLGQGRTVFPHGTVATRFELAEPPTAYPAGVLLQRYRRLDGPPVLPGDRTAAD